MESFDIDIDPWILLSIINMKLRDCYDDLTLLCEDLELSIEDLQEKLQRIGFHYNLDTNQFK